MLGLFRIGRRSSIAIGDSAMISSWTWIEICNEKPVSNRNHTFEYGDKAGIQPGGRITVLNVNGNDLLVIYRPPVGKTPEGTCCPEGALFHFSSADFRRLHLELIAVARKKLEIKRRLIDSLVELVG